MPTRWIENLIASFIVPIPDRVKGEKPFPTTLGA
jgi:hypothetical protein